MAAFRPAHTPAPGRPRDPQPPPTSPLHQRGRTLSARTNSVEAFSLCEGRPARTVSVVVNPKASTGTSASLWREGSEILARRATEYRELETCGDGDDPDRIVQLVREEGSEILVAAGGDGTVGAAVDAIVRLDPSERPALALFPFGTANNIARSLGLMSGRRGGARAIRCAIEAALSGRERRIDLGRVGERYFLGSFALGIDADILAVRNHYTRRFFGSKLVRGYPLYLWSTAQCLTTARATAARVCIDGRARELDVYNLLVTNTSVYAGEFRFHAGDPSADALLDLHLFDGAFDYVTRYAAAWLRHLRHERGAPVASPPKLDSAACIEVELERPVRAQLDGEEIGQLNTCTLAVAAESLTVRVP